MDAGWKVADEVMNAINTDLKYPTKIRGLVLGLDMAQGKIVQLEVLPKEHQYTDLLKEGSEFLPPKDVR